MFYQNYQPEEYNQVFDCTDGIHTLRIIKAECKTAKTGNEMIEVAFIVDENPVPYIERYVNNEFFNRNITRFFDAFKLQRGNFNFETWKQRTAQGNFIHKEEKFFNKSGQECVANKAHLQYLVVEEAQQQSFPNNYRQPQNGQGCNQQNGAYNRQNGYAQPSAGQQPPSARYSTGNGEQFPEEIPF